MPVLDLISLRFQNLHPFEGLKISMCQHLTAETAALAVTLKQGGAEIYMAASNPRSTQEAVVAALVKYHGIHVFANADETQEEYLACMDEVLKIQPDIILDDGAAILPRVYDKYPELAGKLIGTTEQTTAGVAKVEQMDLSGRWPGCQSCMCKWESGGCYGYVLFCCCVRCGVSCKKQRKAGKPYAAHSSGIGSSGGAAQIGSHGHPF